MSSLQEKAREPSFERIFGLLTRMMHDRAYGSIKIQLRRGKVDTVTEKRTHKPDLEKRTN